MVEDSNESGKTGCLELSTKGRYAEAVPALEGARSRSKNIHVTMVQSRGNAANIRLHQFLLGRMGKQERLCGKIDVAASACEAAAAGGAPHGR